MTIKEFKELRNRIAEVINDSQFKETLFFSGECVRNFVHHKNINTVEIGINRKLGGYALAIFLAKKFNCFEKNVCPVFDRKTKSSTVNIGNKIPGLKNVVLIIRETCDAVYNKISTAPELVFGSISQDSLRQDFTVESVFLDFDLQLIRDYVGGTAIKDLKEKRIRLTSHDKDLFYRHPEKMIKAIRLASELGCGIEAKTWLEICSMASRIDFATNEAIREEFNKLICSTNADEGIRKLYFSGLLTFIMPELCTLRSLEQGASHSFKNVFDHSLNVMMNMKPEPTYRLAGLLHDIGKLTTPRNTLYFKDKTEYKNHADKSEDTIKLALCFLSYESDIVENVSAAVKLHMRFANNTSPSKQTVRRFLNEVKKIKGDKDLCLDLIHANNISKDERYQKINQVKLVRGIIEKIEKTDAISKMKLPIKGGDIIARFNLQKGPRIGRAVKILKDHLLISPKMSKEEAYDILDEAYNKKLF